MDNTYYNSHLPALLPQPAAQETWMPHNLEAIGAVQTSIDSYWRRSCTPASEMRCISRVAPAAL